jgi:hypothetical protein
MKPANRAVLVLLGVSLAANGWMAAVWLSRQEKSALAPSSTVERLAVSTRGTDAVATENRQGAATPAMAPARGAWEHFATDDLRELVRRLRAAGFPPAAVSAIAFDQAEERFRAQLLELTGPPEETSYWKAAWRRQHDAKNAEKLKALREKQYALVKEALGPAFWLDPENSNDRQRRFGDLAPEKIEAIKRVTEEHHNRLNDAARASGKLLGAADFTAHSLAERAALAQALSPAELFEYEIRNSPAAAKLIEDTQLLAPSEAEFRALFPLYQQMMETMQTRMMEKGASADPHALFREANEQMAAKLREALGPERYADFVQASDPEQRKLNQIVQRLELPLSVARSVSTVQKDVIARADAVRANSQLSPEQRAAQLGALADEAKARITESLGSRGFGAYQRYGGRWLEMLQTSGGRNPQR